MKCSGFNIEIIRGETCSIAFTLVDSTGKPFVLLTTDTFANLNARFRVKENPYTKAEETYIIDKVLDLNTVKRFSDAEIIDLEIHLTPSLHYFEHQWNNTFGPLAGYENRLFYHPHLNEYRYYENGAWVPYSITLTVPFEPADTVNLDYKEYFYDLVIEADNDGETIEYVNILVNQHRFVISYKV